MPMMLRRSPRYLGKDLTQVSGFMFKISQFKRFQFKSSQLANIAALSLASGAIGTLPYVISQQPSSPKAQQCRALFRTVTQSQNLGKGFYANKAKTLRSLSISDPSLRSLQQRFSQVFTQLETAYQKGDSHNSDSLNRQTTQLVKELNQKCFPS
jgi:hypothetical protein